MAALSANEILFYGGIVGMAFAAAGAGIAGVIFAVSGRRLRKKLEDEFGKKQDT